MVRTCLVLVVFALGYGDPSTEDPAIGEWSRTWPGSNEATAERWFRLDADGMGFNSEKDGGLLEGELYWERDEEEYTLFLDCDTINGDPEPCIGVPSLILKCRYDSSADTLTCENADAPGVEATYTRPTTEA